MTEFQLEMLEGQPQRHVEADSFEVTDTWLVFYRNPAQGGARQEYWRARVALVVSMETKR